jgi:hypothetical protein
MAGIEPVISQGNAFAQAKTASITSRCLRTMPWCRVISSTTLSFAVA